MEFIIAAEAAPLPVPEPYVGRHIFPHPDYPPAIETIEQLKVIVRTRLQELQAESPETADKIAFQIIHHSRITSSVFEALRRKFLPNFSTITWRDVFPYFAAGLN